MKQYAKTLEEARMLQAQGIGTKIFKLTTKTHPKATENRKYFIGSEFEWLNI